MQIYHLASKWCKNHLDPMCVAQDIAEIQQCVKTVFTCISSFECFAFHVFFKPLQIIINHPIIFSNHSISLMIESLNLQKHEIFTFKIHEMQFLPLKPQNVYFYQNPS